MISKLSKPVFSTIFKSQRNYYKLLKPNNVSGDAIPLYSANRYNPLDNVKDTSSFVSAVFNNKSIHERYLKLVPFFLENVSGIHKKHFVYKAGLVENAESLRLSCFTHSGVITKHASLSNIIPVIFDDFQHANRRKMLEMPLFLDHEMIYYNLLEEEFYVFDKEGEWHQEGVNHPLLDLTQRFDERKFYDTFRIY